ncbi:MAG: transglutaminase-like domain-containing protein [Candidatus Bathyarchaeia archaeon]|nr:transglutaminase domain-containing protein [Candidatus Bathyarchaeota archaeon]
MEDSWRGRSNLALLTLALLSFIALSNIYYFGKPVAEERSFKLTVRAVYENRSLNETWILNETDLTLGLFANNSWQKVYLMSATHPIKKFYNDPDGNYVILLDIGEMKVPPGGRISYSVTYRLIYKERKPPIILEDESGELDDIPRDLKEEYCKPTSLWQSNLTEIKKLAQDIAGDERKVLSILKKFIVWISSNIHYATFERPRYPNETLSQRLGDCDDQANLLITFCRAVGIPAYLQIGCIYIPDLNSSLYYWSGHLLIKEDRVGWHGWAMVYVLPWGWLPVDLTYVSMDLRLNPLSAIVNSAVIEHYTFQYLNVTTTDYVREIISMKEFLETSEFYIYEEDIMEFEEKIICPRLPIIRPIYSYTLSSGLITAGIAYWKRFPS